MLDPELNFIPGNVKKIHLISACGTAMGALCVMLKNLGYEVSGSDEGIYPPMSTFLSRNGVVLNKFDPSNIADDTDLVVVGNAVTKNNIEVKEVLEKSKNYVSMPQAINHFFAKDKKVIMVTGTHGKTTTTGLISWILEYAGLNPSFFIGGIHKNFDSGFKNGDGEYFVIEGDEYDTAFFDKESKFLHFKPHRLVITGIEFDHADIFNDISAIEQSFEKLLKNNCQNSLVYGFALSKSLIKVLDKYNGNLVYYGEKGSKNAYYELLDSENGFQKYRFILNDFQKDVFLPMSGIHNILNSVAAFGVCLSLGIDPDIICDAFKSYKGMKRRQELRGEENNIKVIDDFAHHPTEVKYTIDGIKKAYNPKRLICVFEPGTNTSMRNIFQKEYENSFDGSNLVCIKKPEKIKKVEKGKQFQLKEFEDALNQKGIEAHLFEKTDDIISFLAKNAKPHDLVLVMSNKGFDGIHEKLLEVFKK